jgi:hypothetical protein
MHFLHEGISIGKGLLCINEVIVYFCCSSLTMKRPRKAILPPKIR